MVLHPGVDVLHGGLVKGGLIDARVIPGGVGVQKILVHLETVVILQPDGVGDVQLGVLPCGQGLTVGAETGVQFRQWQAEDGFHLGQGLSLGAVGGHGQGAENGQRRNQSVFSLREARLKQAHGKLCRRQRVGFGVLDLGRNRLGLDTGHQVLGLEHPAAGRQEQGG